MNFWDARYAADDYVYGTEPNDFFMESLATLDPGKILLPGEGEGRNAVYAASSGWQVDAFDSSREGYRKAMKLADQSSVRINYQVTDLYQFSFPEAHYDAAGLFFFHAPQEVRRHLHQNVMNSLKPGGLLILEAFHLSQLKHRTGGPGNPEMLFTEALLEKDFSGMHIGLLRVEEKQLNEGVFHQGIASVINLLARKT